MSHIGATSTTASSARRHIAGRLGRPHGPGEGAQGPETRAGQNEQAKRAEKEEPPGASARCGPVNGEHPPDAAETLAHYRRYLPHEPRRVYTRRGDRPTRRPGEPTRPGANVPRRTNRAILRGPDHAQSMGYRPRPGRASDGGADHGHDHPRDRHGAVDRIRCDHRRRRRGHARGLLGRGHRVGPGCERRRGSDEESAQDKAGARNAHGPQAGYGRKITPAHLRRPPVPHRPII